MENNLSKKMFGLSIYPCINFSFSDINLKAQELVGKLSVSGAQPKLSVKCDRHKKELIVTAKAGEFILKPQVLAFTHLPENEQCCMDIAGALNIEVPDHTLLPLKEGSLAYIVKRFDRKGTQKFHQEDFAQILEQRDKYKGSVERIGKKIQQISSIPGLDVQLFYELLVC